jgi:hypothetical protein
LHSQRIVMSKKRDIFEDNLDKEAPLLNAIPKRNPFVVPDGYFDALPSQIMDVCRESTAKKGPAFVYDKIFWLFRPQWMLAVFICVIGISLFLRNGNAPIESYETIAAALPDSVIMQNLQNNIDYVDVSNLEEMAQNQGLMKSLQAQSDTSNGQIINYLINNNVDDNDIENEL